MARIAVITPDVLGATMAGPAIRAVNIAEQLGRDHDVTLISTVQCSIARPGLTCVAAVGSRALRAAVGDAEVVVLQGYVTYAAPWLIASNMVLVVDLYDPLHLEQLEQLADYPAGEAQAMLDLTVRVLNEQLLRGDFFLCANEEQRHLWLGHLGALGRINLHTYAHDNTLRSLIDVVPFGLGEQPPRRTGPGIRDSIAGIGSQDKVILWAGGVYNWFDAPALVRALDQLKDVHPDVRLFFLGMKHPNPDVPQMEMAYRTRALADDLGLTGRHVFFNDGWVAYDDRQNYLLDADVGVSTHFDHLETTFSFRTRILDYLWAGLPVVCTGGDSFGALVAAEGLGATIDEGDVEALARALATVLYDQAATRRAREAVARVREQFTWPLVLAPLLRFCAAPRRAADADLDRARITRRPVMPANRALRLIVRAAILVRRGGPSALAQRATARVRRMGAGPGNDTN